MAEQSEDYRLGQTLGRFAKEQGQRHPAQLRAVIADLIGDDHSLRATLRELVELPAFLDAEPLVASVETTALISFLINELKPIFRSESLARLQEILEGYFYLGNSLQSDLITPPSVVSEAKKDSSSIYDQRKTEEEKTSPQYANNQINSLKSRLEVLKGYLQSEQWSDADIETWCLLAKCCGADEQEPFVSVWSNIPLPWLVEINRIWCEASNYRFGFSIQRGIWDELIELSKRAHKSSFSVSYEERKKIFSIFLREPENPINPVNLPPGFYPRSGMTQRFYRGPQAIWDNSCLINNFPQVHARLVVCGIPPAKLDEATRKQLRDLYIDSLSPSKAASKAKMSSISEQARANRSTTQLKNPSRIQARTPQEVGEPYEEIMLAEIMLAAFALCFIFFVLIALFG